MTSFISPAQLKDEMAVWFATQVTEIKGSVPAKTKHIMGFTLSDFKKKSNLNTIVGL